MSKFHILDANFTGVAPRTGFWRVLVHVDIDDIKNVLLDISQAATFQQDAGISFGVGGFGSPRIRSATAYLGTSRIPAIVATSEHPSFPGPPVPKEDTLITAQDLCEVEIVFALPETATPGGTISVLASLYGGIRARTRTEYNEKYSNYGTTIDPA